jgi:hypothetical protein
MSVCVFVCLHVIIQRVLNKLYQNLKLCSYTKIVVIIQTSLKCDNNTDIHDHLELNSTDICSINRGFKQKL